MLFGWFYCSDSICYMASILLNDELERIWKEAIVAATTSCLGRLRKSTITLFELVVVTVEFRTGHLHQPITCTPLPPYWRVFTVAFLYCIEQCRESKPEQVWILWNDFFNAASDFIAYRTASSGEDDRSKAPVLDNRPPPCPRSLLAKLFPDLTRGIQ
jgi:hypothetical protein